MSVPSQQSTFSIAAQPAKIGEDGTFTVGDRTWHRFYVPRVSGLAQQMQTVMPPENGNVIVATGAYKFGAFAGTEIDIIPRLENSFGWLLEALLGAVSSVTDARFTASGFVEDVTGVNAHLFRFKPTDSSFLPWLAVRRTIPGSTVIGEYAYDCKVTSMRLTFPGAGLISARIGFIGRQFGQEDPASWTYAANFEGSTSVSISSRGLVKVGADELPLTGLSIDFINGMTSPQQEMIIGSAHPDDFVPLQRGCTIRAVYKWANAELYRRILNGGPSAVSWDELPFFTTRSGTVAAFELEVGSPADIAGSDPLQPNKLKVFANKVAWQFDAAGVELAAGELLMLPIVGTVLDPGDGTDYIQVALENTATAYAWPS